MSGSMSSAQDRAIGSDDEDSGSLTEFETNTDHGMDNLDEQYLFIEDEAYYDFNGEEDNREGLNCSSPNVDGEGDSSSEFDAYDHSHASGDDDPVGNTTTQRGSSIVSRP
ncbi:hypothetical protein QYF36_010729 [Acer negundo]|nr:hypothetical protein QYF36_010729 [Acer negundo]